MIISASCDRCEIILSEGEIYKDYDGHTFCRKCEMKNELDFLQRSYKDKMSWLKKTHLKELREIKKKMVEIKSKL
jgi:hypothetical protein